MKPGDHPEFFRLPPPPGRSRESSIRLDREGRFWHAGELVEHRPMAAAFARWIARHPDDGRFILTNGYDWTYFEVEDVPYLVEGVRLEPPSPERVQVWVTLSDGSQEALDPTDLEVGDQEALYVRVKAGRFWARFTRSAQLALAPLLVDHEQGVALEVGGRRHTVRRRESDR